MARKSLRYYKSLDYKLQLTFDREDKCWYAEFPELWGCMADGTTIQEAAEKALRVKDDWLEATHDHWFESLDWRPQSQ